MRSRLFPRGLLLAALLLALSPLGGTAPSSATSCAAPELVLERGQVLGRDLEIDGRFFFRGCGAPRECRAGCSGGCVSDGEARRPHEDVGLRLAQGGRVWILAAADADEDGEISWSATLPPGARPGRAVLTAAGPNRFVVRLAP